MTPSEEFFLVKDREFEIAWNLLRCQTLGLNPTLIQKLREAVDRFYEKDLNSRVKPRTLFACLLIHERGNSFSYLTPFRILATFSVSRRWHRSCKKQYLAQMGVLVTS